MTNTYEVQQYDVGKTKIEADSFQIENGQLLFWARRETEHQADDQLVAAFQSWLSVIEVKLSSVS